MAQRSDFMCDVQGIAYDFERKTGTLKMAADNCCDMDGCISFFKKIDADVKLIETFAGAVPDTIYRLYGKQWHAIAP